MLKQLVQLSVLLPILTFALAAEETDPVLIKIKDERLHNAWKFTPEIISGAQPDEASFQALKEMGVKTVISVDGAKPDVALAERYGLRYVHLPIGYDGVPKVMASTIAKAVNDLPGPVFIHCHHGKHRSPAATAVACVMLGKLDPAKAEAALKQAGTGADYLGLYADARRARPLDAAVLAAVPANFPATAKIPPLQDAMVNLDETWERISALQANKWQAPKDQPGLESVHQALQLTEHFHEMTRTDDFKARPEAYRAIVTKSEAAAEKMRAALKDWAANNYAGEQPAAIAESFKQIGASCKECHKTYRNIPDPAKKVD